MEKTITYVVGIIFSLMAFGMIMYWGPATLFRQEIPPNLSSSQEFVSPYIIITWQTDDPHQGVVHFQDSGTISGRERESDFTKAHRIRINTTKMTTPITYHIESCPIHGQCIVEAQKSYP